MQPFPEQGHGAIGSTVIYTSQQDTCPKSAESRAQDTATDRPPETHSPSQRYPSRQTTTNIAARARAENMVVLAVHESDRLSRKEAQSGLRLIMYSPSLILLSYSPTVLPGLF